MLSPPRPIPCVMKNVTDLVRPWLIMSVGCKSSIYGAHSTDYRYEFGLHMGLIHRDVGFFPNDTTAR